MGPSKRTVFQLGCGGPDWGHFLEWDRWQPSKFQILPTGQAIWGWACPEKGKCCFWAAKMLEKKFESLVSRSCPTLCDPMDWSLPGSSVHGIFQVRILDWVAISFSRGFSRPRDQTWACHIVDRCFTIWATRKVLKCWRVVCKDICSRSPRKRRPGTRVQSPVRVTVCCSTADTLCTAWGMWWVQHVTAPGTPCLLWKFPGDSLTSRPSLPLPTSS